MSASMLSHPPVRRGLARAPARLYNPGGARADHAHGACGPGRLLQRCSCGGQGGECEACRKRRLQRRAWATSVESQAPAAVQRTLDSAGRPLDAALRHEMESRFRHDFSRVRIHDDAQAATSAAGVAAHAYTVGSHIVFGANRYAPSSADGRRLLVHELTHVVQQAGSPSAGSIRIVPADHASEREADRAADSAVRPLSRITAGRSLHRYSHEDCTEDDLKKHIWPADGIAKRQLDAAITAVSAAPPSTTTTALFSKYFMTATPDTGAINKVFKKIKKAFDGDDYTYECEDDCDAGTNAYSGRAWDIHLCMNNLRGRANDCIARTIVHEFSHKYAGLGHGWWFSTASCYSGCNNAGCPSDLDADDALDNAYSFAGFAREV